MTPTQSIISVGQAAALLQAMPQRIKAAALEIGVSPAMVINGVTHFDERDLERIGERLREGAAHRGAGPS